MDPEVRTRYDANRNLADKPFKAACYAPFTSLYFNTAGDVVACCRNQSFILGNIARERLDEIWRGPRINAMRESLLDYRFGPGCEFCAWMIGAGDHQGAMARHFDWLPVDSTQPAFPTQMEFAMGNTCNFACIQCCGDWSSRIRTQREGLPPLAKVYDERFFADLTRYLPHVQCVKFFGGEPFLMPENHRVWDFLIDEHLHPSAYILTNGSLWNARVERVLAQLTPSICVSLDAIADRDLLERIRVGAQFDVLVGNIQRFRAYARAHRLRLAISFSLMRQNWTELGPMLEYCEDNDFDIDVIRVIDPPRFSLFSLPANELAGIADALEAQGATIRPHLSRLQPTWDAVIHSLRENTSARQSTDYHHIKEVDAALRRDPVQMASQCLQRADWTGVVTSAMTVAPTHKDYLHALVLMAHARRQMREFDTCEALLDEALRLTTRHATVFVERAWLRVEQGRLRDAIAEAQQALAAARDDENGQLQRGYALHVIALAAAHSNQPSETLDAVEQWRRLKPDDPEVLLQSGRYLIISGCVQAAQECLQQALRRGDLSQATRDQCLALMEQLGQGPSPSLP